jgi:L-iditol 2-dehydrogenase
MSNFEIIYSKEKGFFQRELSEIPKVIDEGNIIVKPKRVGICGSDLTVLESLSDSEVCLGHEWVGEVVLTSKHSYFKKGDLVTSAAIIGCGECDKCKNDLPNFCDDAIFIGSAHEGMMRSWAKLPERGVIKVPNKTLNSIALLEVAAVADEAINNLKKISADKSKLLIFGCGPVGIFTALKARKEGYDFDIVEVEASRIKRAIELELPVKSLGELLIEKDVSKKYNLLIDCSGNAVGKPGLWKYFNAIANYNMRAVIVGKYINEISLNAKIVGEKALTFKWMRGMSLNVLKNSILEWSEEIEELSSSLISHTFNKNEVAKAFETAKDRKISMKVMINLEE